MTGRDALPLVTIGIACHDAEATIGAALRGALAQDWPNREIIVVDDASRDGSARIVADIAAANPEVRLVRIDANIGGAGVYRRLAEEAKGEFLVLMDDDDVSRPRRVRAQVRALMEHDRDALCFCDRRVRGPARRIIRGLTRPEASAEQLRLYMLDAIALHHDPRFYRANRRRFSALRAHGLGKSSAATCVLALRAETARRIGFDPSLRRYGDSEFNLRAALAGIGAISVPRALVVQTETTRPDKLRARARVWTAAILARHAAEYRRAATPYPGFHPAPAVRRPGPSATIGLLSHNAEATLPRALLSALSQDVSDLEIIVLDDASEDLSAEIAGMLRDPRLRVIRSEVNLGAGAQRARLAEEARGDWLAFFDDDDASVPDRVSRQIADLLRAGGEAISIASAHRHIGGRLSEAHRSLGPLGPLDADMAERLVWRTVLQHSEGKIFLPRTGLPDWRYALGTSLMCGPTQRFRRIGFAPDMRRMQDLEFLVRHTREGGGLIPTDTPLVDVFVTRGAHKRWSRVIESCSALLRRHPGALERLFGISTEEVLARNAERLPEIRMWESLRSALRL